MDLSVGQPSTQRIRLRRSNATEQTIKQNIENLKVRSRNKLVAQLLYYGGGGESPLTRDVAVEELNKAPVHQRLGLKQQNRVPVLGTNTSFLGPKRRDARKFITNRNFNQAGGPINYRNQKITKLFTAQTRLQRIRNGFAPLNRPNITLPQRIRLRRATSAPRNYTVRVQNTTPSTRVNGASFLHSVKRCLNRQYQHEIELIQQQCNGSEPLNLNEPVLITATIKTLHQRFSELP